MKYHSKPQGSFRKKYSFDKRIIESTKIIEKYPQRIPTIVESNDFDVEKRKYLVPYDLTLGQFSYVVRKRIKLPPESAMFLLVDEPKQQKYACTLPNLSQLMNTVYEKHRDNDGFLYIYVTKDNVFGN